MKPAGQRFHYSQKSVPGRPPVWIPLLPAQFTLQQPVVENALLDTGADINILPYSVGLRIGAVWKLAPKMPQIFGIMSQIECHAISIPVVIGHYPMISLAFAWADTDAIPLIFGQYNFFDEFDVCFFRSRREFELRPKN